MLARLFSTKNNTKETSFCSPGATAIILSEKQKQQLKNILKKIPENFEDYYTNELPREVVFSPYGHFYDLAPLSELWFNGKFNCPLSTLFLNEELLLKGHLVDKLTALFEKMKTEMDYIERVIDFNSNQKVVGDLLNLFTKKVFNFYRPQIESGLYEIKKVHNFKTQAKLYPYLPDHLVYWSNLKPPDSIFNSKLQDFNNKEYTVPNFAAKLMKVANETYENADELIDKVIKEAKALKQETLAANMLDAKKSLETKEEQKTMLLRMSV